MATVTDMEVAAKRKANMSSNFVAGMRTPGVTFVALFSAIYGMENNCMSGIAMFIVGASGSVKKTGGPSICHN
jgi:hypothetical protein